MGVVENAMKHIDEIKELAVEAARDRLVEELTPALRSIVERQLGVIDDDVDRVRRGEPGEYSGESHPKGGKPSFEESVETGDETMAEKKHDEEELPVVDAAGEGDIESLLAGGDEGEGEGEGEKEKGEKEKEEKEPEVEIDEAALRAVYDESLKTEAAVSKGFKDMAPPAEEIDPKSGAAEVKTGEHYHNDVEPPAKKDWTVKEAKIRQLIQQGIAENRSLRDRNAKLSEMVKQLSGKLHEVNLFNTKVMSVNRILARAKLTAEQRKTVIESIDSGKTIDEVKKVAAAIEAAYRPAQPVNEAKRRPATDGVRKPSGVISESADKGAAGPSRWELLAGLGGK